MGKSTISMAIFNSYVSHYQRVWVATQVEPQKINRGQGPPRIIRVQNMGDAKIHHLQSGRQVKSRSRHEKRLQKNGHVERFLISLDIS